MKYDLVNEVLEDTTKVVGKACLNEVPIIGPLVSAAIDIFSNKVSKKRFEKWAKLVEKKLENLEKKIDETNERFFSALVKTTQIVAKTHQDEKLEYLANALMNSDDIDLEDDLSQYFLGLIEKYTPSHIKVLLSYPIVTENIFYEQNKIREDNEIQGLRKIYSSQLSSDGLIGFAAANDMGEVLMPLGEKFLRFILTNSKDGKELFNKQEN